MYVSLNGVDYADTSLTFTYYRTPLISRYTPHGGGVSCDHSALNEDGTLVTYDEAVAADSIGYQRKWKAGTAPIDACHLDRNWAAAPAPAVAQLLAAGYGAGYGAPMTYPGLSSPSEQAEAVSSVGPPRRTKRECEHANVAKR